MFNFNNIINNYPFLQIEILRNTVFDWLLAAVVFLIVMTVLKIFKTILIAKLKSVTKKTKTEIDDIVINAIHSIHWPFYVFVSFYFALDFLDVHILVQRWVYYIFLIAVVYYVVKAVQQFTDFAVKKIIKKRKEKGEVDGEAIKILNTIIKILLWIGAIVLVLSNLGYNVTSLIAGLGIGGIAVALAMQNILGDIFSSFSIYFDKPFRIGDFIVIGDQMGTVKKVGIKTTRVQTPQGEELVIPNNELTKAQVRNFGVMERRRIVFNLGVTYDTPAEKLKKIPEMIKNIIKAQAGTEVDRIHFKTFGDSSLIFEIVYYVDSGDYAKYMDTQQAINLAIVDKFEEQKIEIAFPTQTIYIKK